MQPDLLKFAQMVFDLSDWPYSDLDGGDLQDIAVKCGLLVPTSMREPCGDGETTPCQCLEYYGGEEFKNSITCYRKCDVLLQKQKA